MSKARSAGRKCRMTASYERSKATGSEGEIARKRTRGVWGAILSSKRVRVSEKRNARQAAPWPSGPRAANFAHPSRWRPEGRSRGLPVSEELAKFKAKRLLAIGAIGLKRERCQWAHVAYGLLAMGRSKGSSQS